MAKRDKTGKKKFTPSERRKFLVKSLQIKKLRWIKNRTQIRSKINIFSPSKQGIYELKATRGGGGGEQKKKNIIVYSERAKRARKNLSCVFQS